MTDRPFTNELRRRGSLPLAIIPGDELASLQSDAQAAADWLQSQAAEAQRLAGRCRKELRRRHMCSTRDCARDDALAATPEVK